MEEKIIVSLTTWKARINNIPTVLDSIYSQTLPPDLVVLNLAYEEEIPDKVSEYIAAHNIIVNRVPDTKVYKKLFPTLELFPNDCVISIDDDFLYPPTMIQDFMKCHHLHPNSPISGNKCYYKNFKCHCGCASLTKKKHFGKYYSCLDQDVITNCPSDDIVYTFLVNKAGRHYVFSEDEYFVNLTSVNPVDPYSSPLINPIEKSWNYLINRFGPIRSFSSLYRSKYLFHLMKWRLKRILLNII